MMKYLVLLLLSIFFSCVTYAQISDQVSIKKPDHYSKRTLPFENSKGKFGFLKRFFNNQFTYYNYYFNANRKFAAVMEQSKASQLDDYTKPIAFYPYNIEAASASTDLDSVIQKSTAGILFHDLRNDWIDDLFLLIGKSYYFKKQFDSAIITFQYINYAFGPRDKDGRRKVIGSNQGGEKNLFTIFKVTEKGTINKAAHQSKARDEALIWLVKAYIETNQIAEAESTLQVLKNDADIPPTIKPLLLETQAYLFYKQQQFDSAAAQLSNCIHHLYTGNTYARQAFLTAQLYEQVKNQDAAIGLYKKAAQQATDPALEAYARLQTLKLSNLTDSSLVQENIAELLRMTKKEKYTSYKSILFFVIANMEYNSNHLDEAKQWLLKSIKYSDNVSSRNQSFLLLGDIAFNQQQFGLAANWYDSLSMPLLNTKDYNRINNIKRYISIIQTQERIINKEDSLQHLASLPSQERLDILKKMVRQMRKQHGISEEQEQPTTLVIQSNIASDLFKTNNNAAYFDNPIIKTQGYGIFLQQWGKRPNVDNWRRRSAFEKTFSTVDNNATTYNNNLINDPLNEITIEGLLKTIPLTDEQRSASKKRIQTSLQKIAEIAQNGLEIYPFAIEKYLQLLQKNPPVEILATIYFNLNYCYARMGKLKEASYYKELLMSQFPKSNETEKIIHNEFIQNIATQSTIAYNNLYNTFIEGDFIGALQQKKQFDSTYGQRFYTPQLLFIQSIYYVKEKQDSLAIEQLQALTQQFPNSTLYNKAQHLISIIKRRKEIEERLTNLQITRVADEEDIVLMKDESNVRHTPALSLDTVKTAPKSFTSKINQIDPIALKDASLQKEISQPNTLAYTFNPNNAHIVMIILEKVAPMFTNEARNAFDRYHKSQLYQRGLITQNELLDSTHSVLLVQPFKDMSEAIDYIHKVKPISASEVIPWLTNTKYSFLPIDVENWKLLRDQKKLIEYKQFLHTQLPKIF